MKAAVIAVLISQLGSPSFPTRERAHAALHALGAEAHPQLLAAETHADHEIRARSRLILDQWHVANAERMAAAHESLPWISTDPLNDEPETKAYVARALGSEEPHTFEIVDAALRNATYLMIVDMYRTRRTPAEIAAALRALAAAEEECRQYTGPEWTPNLTEYGPD